MKAPYLPSFSDNLKKSRLPTIPGVVPDLRSLPTGCRFQDRCPDVVVRCRREEPSLLEFWDRHRDDADFWMDGIVRDVDLGGRGGR